ncbi:MAG: winged helix-turn-helix domain-containing protein [Myxococcota bacterium]
MQLKVRISFRDEQGSFMGIGLVWLLKGINKHNSINKAAREMSLSYPKAIRILNRLEEATKNKILNRQRGGPQGGGANLTEFGQSFLNQFEQFNQDITKYAEKKFIKDFENNNFFS